MINQYKLDNINYNNRYQNHTKPIINYNEIMEQIIKQKNQLVDSRQYEDGQNIKYKLNKSKQLKKYMFNHKN